MTAIACPYCGAALNQPLKFCLSCGRGVSKADLTRLGGLKNTRKAGVTKRLDDAPNQSNFDLAKKSYGTRRNIRQVLTTACYVLILVLLYYFAVRFLLKESVPGHADELLRNLFSPTTSQQKQEPPPVDQAQEVPAVESLQPAPAPPPKPAQHHGNKQKRR